MSERQQFGSSYIGVKDSSGLITPRKLAASLATPTLGLHSTWPWSAELFPTFLWSTLGRSAGAGLRLRGPRGVPAAWSSVGSVIPAVIVITASSNLVIIRCVVSDSY